MNRNAFESSISEAWTAVEKAKLGETISTGSSLPVNEDFRNTILRSDASYTDVYMMGLSMSHYNFSLSDHSFFQFSWSSSEEMRLAYYPNPFMEKHADRMKEWAAMLSADMLTFEEISALAGSAKASHARPMFRFEMSTSQYKPSRHPCAHFHIGFWGDDRWAVRRVLSPSAFTLLILKMYYGTAWHAFEEQDNTPYPNSMDQSLSEARARCSPVNEEWFGHLDESLFYFA
jgi:hypothetical protein